MENKIIPFPNRNNSEQHTEERALKKAMSRHPAGRGLPVTPHNAEKLNLPQTPFELALVRRAGADVVQRVLETADSDDIDSETAIFGPDDQQDE